MCKIDLIPNSVKHTRAPAQSLAPLAGSLRQVIESVYDQLLNPFRLARERLIP
jgi:hypothetical protein